MCISCKKCAVTLIVMGAIVTELCIPCNIGLVVKKEFYDLERLYSP